MSSSYRNRVLQGTALATLAFAGNAGAQQRYFIPSAEVSAEHHTNRELTPLDDVKDPTTGYIAKLEALIGTRTERSQTELRPRIRVQEYPDRDGIDPVEAFLDLQSDYKSLRNSYSITASLARQDTFNVEFGDAGFGEEGDPDRTDTGIVFGGTTRTSVRLEPSFERQISERNGLGLQASFNKTSFDDGDDPLSATASEDFTNSSLTALFTRKTGLRTKINVGPYATRYQSDVSDLRINSAGLTAGWAYQFSQITAADISMEVERSELDTGDSTANGETETSWGLAANGSRQLETGSLRYSIGRFLVPSSVGGRVQRDEARIQYERPLSQRLTFKAALRAGQDERFKLGSDSDERRVVRTDLGLRWLMTPRFYVFGGYRFAWQERELTAGSPAASRAGDANNHTVLLGFGFSGMDERRGDRRGKSND